jgi:hypothetical protein
MTELGVQAASHTLTIFISLTFWLVIYNPSIHKYPLLNHYQHTLNLLFMILNMGLSSKAVRYGRVIPSMFSTQ